MEDGCRGSENKENEVEIAQKGKTCSIDIESLLLIETFDT